jgi:hypothetical protein
MLRRDPFAGRGQQHEAITERKARMAKMAKVDLLGVFQMKSVWKQFRHGTPHEKGA